MLSAVRAQACEYLSKPFSPKDAVEVAERALREDALGLIEVVSAKPEWVELLIPCSHEAADRVHSFLKKLDTRLPEESLLGIRRTSLELTGTPSHASDNRNHSGVVRPLAMLALLQMAISDWKAREIVFFVIGLALVTTGTRSVGDYRNDILLLAVASALAFVFFRRRTRSLIASSLSCILSLGLMASQKQDRQPVEQKADIKAGAETYGKYCASCHGKQGKGDGPVAEVLKIAPSDLTALAKTYEGKFPRGYVSAVLIFGKRVTSHGSDDMPVWGAKFRKIDPEHDRSGQKHIDDLVAYLESIQTK